MSEHNDISPRRRRIRIPEENETPAAAGGDTSRIEIAEKPGDTAQTQGPYSRVPEEARRMSASPYGAVNAAAVRQGAAGRDAFRNRGTAPQPIRHLRTTEARSPYQRPLPETADEPTSRVRVGYAPGQMQMNEARISQEPAGNRVYPNARIPSAARPAPARAVPARPAPGRMAPEAAQEGAPRKHTLLHLLAALLIAAGAFLAVMVGLPQDNGLRQQVAGLAKKIPGIRALAETEKAEPEETEPEVKAEASPTVDQFASTDNLDALLGTISTEQKTEEAEPEQQAEAAAAESESAPPAGREEQKSAVPEETPSEESGAFEPELTAAALGGEDAEEDPDAPGEDPEAETETDMEVERLPESEAVAAAAVTADTDEAAEEGTADEDAVPEKPEPLTAEAVPAANPSLIKTVGVYSGKKAVKEYARPAKDIIQMPNGWEYTKAQIGVLTFRGNAFRTNGAVGTVESSEGLSLAWTADSGSAKGASQTYYGTGWPGQPAIVKWSRQVRESSNIYEKKREKEGLKEVIVAGLDGNIRFLDLETGELTRNSIKLGYPMRGTPSVHPSGYPYMSVGQYARKMKNGTGKIGLRQYNMYTGSEITLIDGTDKGMNRAYNSNNGAFQTSALIDRVSETEVAIGSNGLLYLIDLNSEFDWNIGIYKSKQESVVMRSLASGEKKENTAVESSPAMYDKYVFYADLGGILRCVDTNFLTPVWAVDTKDAVMATVALDMPDAENLYLYTANMLKNRKSGNAQIRCYNAMNGKEIWCTEIGVKKDTKNKTDSGVKASPVIGENSLSGLVYFTVTGLSDDGRSKLGVEADTKAALVALDKETGDICWAYGLSDRSESSPIAVYDENGNGWIIQCAWDGTIVRLDGITGDMTASLKVGGNIEASPAAYNDMLVIGTTGKGTEKIYGVRIGPAKETAAADAE